MSIQWGGGELLPQNFSFPPSLISWGKTLEHPLLNSSSTQTDWTLSYHNLFLSFLGGRTLDEMKRMFFELKDNVFKKQSKLIPTACDTDALEELLKKNLGEHIKMRSVTKPKWANVHIYGEHSWLIRLVAAYMYTHT